MMDDKTLEIIKELMEQLQDEMKPSAMDFDERLGKKPKVEVIKVEGKLPGEEGLEKEEDMGMDLDSDGEMEMGPEDSLKKRLMKLRS